MTSSGVGSLLIVLSAVAQTQPVAGPGFHQPMRHGVVFWQPSSAEEAEEELDAVAADGYRLLKLASWCWTLPTPGSDVEASAQYVLDGCDARGLDLFLLQNIQFGSPAEGGGLDQAIADPLAARVFLDDWIRVLQGRPCLRGVILGNEVSPVLGSRKETPLWWEGLLKSLQERHGTIEALNSAWRTSFTSWNDIELPSDGAPGMVDVRVYAEGVFADFYGALFDGLLRPALGDLEYGVKAGGDPFLHRRTQRASVLGWDDVLANYPQWRIKGLCDVARLLDRPVFNAELHVYHDTYVFNQSVAMTRYRYLTSALNGETTTASFAWEQWGANADTAAIHAQTPGLLEDLDGLAEPLGCLASVEPDVHVLLTRRLCEGADDGGIGERPRAEEVYAQASGLGAPWRFVLPQDVHRMKAGTLVIPEDPRLGPSEAQAISALSEAVSVVCVGAVPGLDEYGRPLGRALVRRLERRCRVIDSMAELRGTANGFGIPYTDMSETPYLWWQPDRGHFTETALIPTLEARRAPYGKGWLVAVINHATTGDPIHAALPWRREMFGTVRELTDAGVRVDPDRDLTFPPLSVRLFVTGE